MKRSRKLALARILLWTLIITSRWIARCLTIAFGSSAFCFWRGKSASGNQSHLFGIECRKFWVFHCDLKIEFEIIHLLYKGGGNVVKSLGRIILFTGDIFHFVRSWSRGEIRIFCHKLENLINLCISVNSDTDSTNPYLCSLKKVKQKNTTALRITLKSRLYFLKKYNHNLD